LTEPVAAAETEDRMVSAVVVMVTLTLLWWHALSSLSGAMEQSSSQTGHESAAAMLPSSTSAPCFLPDPAKRSSTPISVPSHIRFYKQAEHDRQNLMRCCPTKVSICYAYLQ